MLKQLHHANMEWLRSFRRGAGEPPILQKKETAFDLVASTTLATAQTSGAVTADLSSGTDFDDAGAFVIYTNGMPDVQENATKSSNTLTGVTGGDFAHAAGDRVIKLYALPSTFHSFRSTPTCPGGVQVNNTPYSFASDDPKIGEFSLYDNGTTKFLWLPQGISGDCRVLFNRLSTTIDATDDTVDVPAEYELFLVYRLVAHGHRVRGIEPGVDIQWEQMANGVLREAHMEKNVGKMPHLRPINPNKGLSHDDYYRLVSRDS
jgi:hypothetical protein